MQIKLAEYHNVPIIPISNLSRFNTSFKFPSYEVKVEEPIETNNPKIKNIPTTLKFPTIKRQKRFVSSNDSFTSVLDKLAAEDESIAKNKDILSRLAQVESNQRWNARNDRAYGAFQLMDFNITGDVNDFINNPEEQIKQANRLLEFNKSQFTKRDLELAQKQGYSYDQLLAGAWLGGVGSVRKVLNGTGNPSDKDGADVRSRMQNFQTGGIINKWLDDWNKARYNTGRFNDQLGNNQINIQKWNRDNAPVFHSSEERDKALGITNPIAQRYYNSNLGIISTSPIRFKGGFYERKDKFIQMVSPKQREYLENKFTSRLTNQQKQYEYMSPEWQQIEAQKKEVGNIFKTNGYDSQLLHEQSHASRAIPQETKISTIVPTEDKYLDDPSEIYSRLNQLRQYYKLDPNKIYQKSDIKKLRGPGFDILNRYDDKTILRLLNEVANNNTKPELVNYAQDGLKISREKLELIDKLRKQGQTYIKADNSTKELKEANNRARRNKQIGENIKSIALNTAEGVASAVYPAVGAGLAIKNSYNNPIGGIIDAVSTALPYIKFSRFKNSRINTSKNIIQSKDKFNIDEYYINRAKFIYNNSVKETKSYLNSDELLNRAAKLDNEYGTSYLEAVNFIKDNLNKIPVHYNQSLQSNAKATAMSGDINKVFDFNNYRIDIGPTIAPESYFHEVHHLIDYVEALIRAKKGNKPLENYEQFQRAILSNSRNQKLLIDNNITSKEEFRERIKKIFPYSDKDIDEEYDYLLNKIELEPNLTPILLDNMRNGRQLYDLITDDKYLLDLYRRTGQYRPYFILNGLIKDKQIFTDKLKDLMYTSPLLLEMFNDNNNEK